MPKNIKITEEQYKILMEADENMFPYVTNSPFKPFDGYNNITPEGNKEGEEKADSRTTADTIQQKLRPQSYNAYRIGNTGPIPTTLREVKIDGSINNGDDFEEIEGFNYVAKLKEQVQIPKLTQERIKLLLNSTKGLNVKQQTVILYDLINEFTSQLTNNQTRKVFDSLLREFCKKTGLSRTIEKELENAD